ncbi:hypothetical protein OKA05_22200 [Luteolibacter arcticus]|uniref:Uncharacterized protein n=1 Tax=Luteolibacter arcticus TaxID=1581411 RepID=A0ABT3GP45_9BACT|nr:hypothetical protein [Luteolibacter arcticus]MCW1925289.1 hypothetical protein [Luteolibacter arcticus]
MKPRRRKQVLIGASIYLFLWSITALVGLPQVDQAFERELAMGSFEFADTGIAEVPVRRIEFFNISNPEDLEGRVSDQPWKCRSAGLAVAPFVIVDQAAWQQYPLSGFGGRRLVLWTFGYVRWRPLKKYWVS